MKIDIYIPTYNRKDLLKKAIDSALAQTYPNITIIVSDNASSDGTDVMMGQMALENPKIHYYRQDQNLGALGNCQKCIYEYGVGEFALFLSDDDELLDPAYIEKAVQYIGTHKNTNIIIGNTRIYYSDLSLTFDTNSSLLWTTSGKEFFLKYGTESYSISWCNALFRRDIAIQNDCYNGEIFYADSDCFFRLMMFGDVGFINTVASLYRIHAKNTYKVVSADTYLRNEAYIHRNYEFAKKTWKFTLHELNEWRDRLLSWYRSTLLDNLMLFTTNPIHSVRRASVELQKRWYSLTLKRKVRLSLLFVIRFVIRFKPVFRFLVSHNYKK